MSGPVSGSETPKRISTRPEPATITIAVSRKPATIALRRSSTIAAGRGWKTIVVRRRPVTISLKRIGQSPSKYALARTLANSSERRENGKSQRGAEDPVVATVAMLEKRWDKYQADAGCSRDAVYDYLQPLFDTVQNWQRMRTAGKYSLRALKLHGLPPKMTADPFARMIFATSKKGDPRQRSKWAKVMRRVAIQKEKDESFKEFVKRHGGLNRCAD